MSIQLNIDEMLEILNDINHPNFTAHKSTIESVATSMAYDLAKHFDCQKGLATFQGLGFAGTCAPFYPGHEGQECPAAFAEHDDPMEWEWVG